MDSQIKLFGDETMVWSQIQNAEDRQRLQSDLLNVCDWSSKWLLKFSFQKCKCMHLGTKNNGHKYYMLDESGHFTLDKISEEKD